MALRLRRRLGNVGPPMVVKGTTLGPPQGLASAPVAEDTALAGAHPELALGYGEALEHPGGQKGDQSTDQCRWLLRALEMAWMGTLRLAVTWGTN